MGTVVDLLATIITVVGLLAALGYGGYLLMLNSVAAKRPGTAHITADAKKRLPAAGGLAVGALIAVLIATGSESVPWDVIALLIGGGLGFASVNRLQAARRRLANPQS